MFLDFHFLVWSVPTCSLNLILHIIIDLRGCAAFCGIITNSRGRRQHAIIAKNLCLVLEEQLRDLRSTWEHTLRCWNNTCLGRGNGTRSWGESRDLQAPRIHLRPNLWNKWNLISAPRRWQRQNRWILTRQWITRLERKTNPFLFKFFPVSVPILFPVLKFSDTGSDTFSGTKFFRYRYRYFFPVPNFSDTGSDTTKKNENSRYRYVTLWSPQPMGIYSSPSSPGPLEMGRTCSGTFTPLVKNFGSFYTFSSSPLTASPTRTHWKFSQIAMKMNF